MYIPSRISREDGDVVLRAEKELLEGLSSLDDELVSIWGKELEGERATLKTTQINLDKLIAEFNAEKQGHDGIKAELAQEIAKFNKALNDYAVEKEQHNATKRELETAKLPFWKKFGM